MSRIPETQAQAIFEEAFRIYRSSGLQDRVDDLLRGVFAPAGAGPAPQDPYTVLGVDPGSPLPKAEAVYKKLAAIYHPDKPTGNREAFERVTRAIQELRRRT